MKRNQFMIELLTELAPEIRAAQTVFQPVQPALNQVLAELAPLPREALFLGVADDGLPVLLNILDPTPGPIIISGDAGSGKTNLLKSIASGIGQIHDPRDVQYGVVTNFPEEWKNIVQSQNCVDIFPAYKNSAQDFVDSLTTWAHANKGEGQHVVLLIDDVMSVINMDFNTRQNFRWLLTQGPSHRTWPIVTLNPDQYLEVYTWLELFRTRLIGWMGDDNAKKQITGSLTPDTRNLARSNEFIMREGRDWIRFWIPAVE